MNSLLRYALVALLLIVGVVLLSVCADGLGEGCGHACCTGADRSRPLQRLARRLKSRLRSAVDMMLLLLSGAGQGVAASSAPPSPVRVIAQLSALRI